jgi:cytohesin
MAAQLAAVDGGDAARRAGEKTKHRKTAVLRFNGKPKLGLEYLKGMGLWDGTPEGLAAWVAGALETGLSKRRVGEFFGGTHPLATPTFDAWLGLLGGDLGPGATLDGALRVLLRKFRLPGEAQCIDRVMEGFARAFKRANPPESAEPWPYSEDAAYVLSFSLVMLNTDLHSQNIKDADRMTRDGFVSNNRGIDAGGADLPRALLEALYDGVKREEIKMDEGDLYESELITYMGARKAGWLEKCNDKGLFSVKHRWRKLWFVLNDGCLYYFLSPGDADVAEKPPRAIVPLDQGLEVLKPLGAAPGREFTLVAREDDAGAQSGPRRPIKSMKHTSAGPSQGTADAIRLRARDVSDAQAWAAALRAEEEALPAGGAALTAAKAAAAARQRRLSAAAAGGGGVVAPAADKWKAAKQPNSHTPLHAGWLRKRGEINTAWRKRYFALFSGVTCTDVEGEIPPPDEPVLMYFKDEDKFRDLVAGAAARPYKGAVRLGAVTEMKRRTADAGEKGKRAAGLALVTGDRTWYLAAVDDKSAGDLEPWWYALEGACHAAQLGATARRPSSSNLTDKVKAAR